jgi:hypothetical protein
MASRFRFTKENSQLRNQILTTATVTVVRSISTKRACSSDPAPHILHALLSTYCFITYAKTHTHQETFNLKITVMFAGTENLQHVT